MGFEDDAFGRESYGCECGGVITEYPAGVFTCSECTFYEETETKKEALRGLESDGE